MVNKWALVVAGLLIWIVILILQVPGSSRDPLPAVQAWKPGDPIEVQFPVLADSRMGSAFEGKMVRVSGYCHFEFEGSALYSDRKDLRDRPYESGVRLGVSWPVPDRFKQFNDTYVSVVGRFTTHEVPDLFKGMLVDIQQISVGVP